MILEPLEKGFSVYFTICILLAVWFFQLAKFMPIYIELFYVNCQGKPDWISCFVFVCMLIEVYATSKGK